MGWLLLGFIVGGAYGAVWAWMLLDVDDDERSIREWERQQKEWRGDRR